MTRRLGVALQALGVVVGVFTAASGLVTLRDAAYHGGQRALGKMIRGKAE